ncbi:hypothetical protein AB0H28_26830 [Micromonospora sp. NPDC050980]|uniref:hypothetical protein n=1 Tax=Micromonospora sp. NPDC050980 TaxID=3155161 RepID=UPI0033FB19A5
MDTLIMYNTTVGVMAGLALMLVPRFWAVASGTKAPLLFMDRTAFSRTGWVAAFAGLALVLYPLALAGTLLHPLHSEKSWIDTLFFEPSLILGAAVIAAGWWLARHVRHDDQVDIQQLRAGLVPTTWIIFWIGVVLVFCAAAIVRFDAVGGAPEAEPITGRIGHLPAIENLGFGLGLYGLAALGCLVFGTALRGRSRLAWHILYWSWSISGAGFALFSALNFYTHTGLLINFHHLQTDPGFDIFRW